MKLSAKVAKLTQGKAKMYSVLGGLVVAGAALTAGTPAAQAQVAFGVQFGGPRYVAPPPPVARPYPAYGYGFYGDRAYWDQRRAAEWRAHDYWDRRRADGFYGRPVPPPPAPYRGW